MNKDVRIKAIKAMEFMVRNLNAEDYMYDWLTDGIADGDIAYGDLGVNPEDYETLDYWLEDENFSELMALFLSIMSWAKKDGGIYCDGVVSK